MDKKNYIPKDKSDIIAVKNLNSLLFDVVKSDVPRLLESLQDMHWDIAFGVAKYFIPYVSDISNELLLILKTGDENWKFNIINALVKYSPDKLDPELLREIERIAKYPSEGEIEDGAHFAAKQIIENRLLYE